jgi:hypothetical protein
VCAVLFLRLLHLRFAPLRALLAHPLSCICYVRLNSWSWFLQRPRLGLCIRFASLLFLFT